MNQNQNLKRSEASISSGAVQAVLFHQEEIGVEAVDFQLKRNCAGLCVMGLKNP